MVYKGRLNTAHCRGNAEYCPGKCLGGKYAQKDASKVNMYEIAQLSRASAAPAKSCAEVERTSKREELSREEPETERKIACA